MLVSLFGLLVLLWLWSGSCSCRFTFVFEQYWPFNVIRSWHPFAIIIEVPCFTVVIYCRLGYCHYPLFVCQVSHVATYDPLIWQFCFLRHLYFDCFFSDSRDHLYQFPGCTPIRKNFRCYAQDWYTSILCIRIFFFSAKGCSPIYFSCGCGRKSNLQNVFRKSVSIISAIQNSHSSVRST